MVQETRPTSIKMDFSNKRNLNILSERFHTESSVTLSA